MARNETGNPKISYSIRVQSHVYEAIKRIAEEKKWSVSQTTDELLVWVAAQLERAGDSLDALLKLEVPDTSDERIAKDVEILKRAERSLKKSH